MNIKILNKSNNPLPKYSTEGSSGMDIRANIDEKIVLKPMSRILIPTGLFMEIPLGYECQIRGRSGLALKNGISLANGIGTIDSDYRGEVGVILINLGEEDFIIKPGDRIAQMVICKIEMASLEVVEVVEDTDRGDGGFGSSGIK